MAKGVGSMFRRQRSPTWLVKVSILRPYLGHGINLYEECYGFATEAEANTARTYILGDHRRQFPMAEDIVVTTRIATLFDHIRGWKRYTVKKKDELTNPNSCMSKAHDDEMTFVLLARDPAAPAAIQGWIYRRVEMGLNDMADQKIKEAKECRLEMLKYQERIKMENTEWGAPSDKEAKERPTCRYKWVEEASWHQGILLAVIPMVYEDPDTRYVVLPELGLAPEIVPYCEIPTQQEAPA